MTKDDAGFLSRWSRRKTQAREEPVERPAPAPAPAPAPQPAPAAPTAITALPAVAALDPAAAGLPVQDAGRDHPAAPPLPTLEDVAGLGIGSDYTRFVARGVSPDVKNAALKKLFADPHYNVMDGLDTYIDDYGKPDPLPAGMLRRMVQSEFLGLFSDEDKPQQLAGPAAAAGDVDAQGDTVAPDGSIDPVSVTDSTLQTAAVANATPHPTPSADEDTDLQLQPDDDAGRTGAAPGPGEDAGRQH